jgi:hypothetical protein
VRARFQEVTLKATRRWTEEGRKRQQTRTFMQTINPFNLDREGRPKTREQIMDELHAEAETWLRERPGAKVRGA